MIKLQLKVIIKAWDYHNGHTVALEKTHTGAPALASPMVGFEMMFTEESMKDLKQYHSLDAVKEVVGFWWHDLEKVLPGRLEEMARKALGV